MRCVVVIVMLLSSIVLHGWLPHPLCGQEPKKVSSSLSREEMKILRTAIYEDGLWTTTRTDTPFPQREIVIRIDVMAIHTKHRVETLRFLLDIVKGGRPEDARAAGVTALSLEDPPGPLLLVDLDVNFIDNGGKNKDLPTLREQLIEQVEEAIRKAEKSVGKK